MPLSKVVPVSPEPSEAVTELPQHESERLYATAAANEDLFERHV